MTNVLLEAGMPDDPLALFADWYAGARDTAPGDPTAVTLATADASGRPAARVVRRY